MSSIENTLMRAINDVENPEWSQIVEAAAFNLGFASSRELLNHIENLKHPTKLATMKRRLERNILENGGDSAWLQLHKK